MQKLVNLPGSTLQAPRAEYTRIAYIEYNGYFTGNFTCGTHATFPAIIMQLLPAFAGKNTRNRTQKDPQSPAKVRTI